MSISQKKTNNKRASLIDVALACGISSATVSKVLNGSSGSAVSDHVRELVLEAAKKLNYRPHRMAQFIESGRTGQLAFIFPRELFTNYSWRASSTLSMEIFASFADCALAKNYMTNLLFCPLDAETFINDTLLSKRSVDGAVLYSTENLLLQAAHFRDQGIPVVSFDSKAEKYDLDTIVEESNSGVHKMVEEIARLGHRRIGYCSYTNQAVPISKRLSAYQEYARKFGLSIHPDNHFSYEDEVDSYVKTRQLFASRWPNERPTAMFYPSDHSAIAGIHALLDLGLRVPDDVSVIGYDGAPYNIHSKIPLATIQVDRKKAGELAAQFLLDAIFAKQPHTGPRTLTYGTEFIPNISLGTAPSSF